MFFLIFVVLTVMISPSFTLGLSLETKFKCSPAHMLYPYGEFGCNSSTVKDTVLPLRSSPLFSAVSNASVLV